MFSFLEGSDSVIFTGLTRWKGHSDPQMSCYSLCPAGQGCCITESFHFLHRPL